MVGPESQHCSHTSVQQLNTFSTAAESSNELRSPPAAALRRGKFCSKFLGTLTTTPGTNTVGVVVAIAATSPSAKSATEVIIMNFCSNSFFCRQNLQAKNPQTNWNNNHDDDDDQTL
jgi:hypothetical protein